jgi:hypothetical protein
VGEAVFGRPHPAFRSARSRKGTERCKHQQPCCAPSAARPPTAGNAPSADRCPRARPGAPARRLRSLLHAAVRRLRAGRRPLHLCVTCLASKRPGASMKSDGPSTARTEAGGVIVRARDEAQARALFQERYRNTPSLLTRQIEQRVIGGDWGANGYTTMAQANTSPASFTCRPPTACSTWGRGGLARAVPGRSDRLCGRPHRPAPGRAAGGHQPRRQRSARRPHRRGGLGGQRAAVSSRQLRRHHPHRRAVLTARQALRAESLPTAPGTRRSHRLLHHP